jgi:hypothetical protein
MPSTQRQPLAACTRYTGGVATDEPYVAIPWQREWLSAELGLLAARWRGRRTVRRVNRARHRAPADTR